MCHNYILHKPSMLLLVNEPTLNGTLQQKVLESVQIEIQQVLLIVLEGVPDIPSL